MIRKDFLLYRNKNGQVYKLSGIQVYKLSVIGIEGGQYGNEMRDSMASIHS